MMTRKKWTSVEDVTKSLQNLREKKKWQIALRRYVLEQLPSNAYAPYFGLENVRLREWFEVQFHSGMAWDNFGKQWQFDQVIPVTFFNLEEESDKRLCWNFTNLRVGGIKEDNNYPDSMGAKAYFNKLFEVSDYSICKEQLRKIEMIEQSQLKISEPQASFLANNKEHLLKIKGFTTFEFELLNKGRSPDMVKQEAEILNRFSK